MQKKLEGSSPFLKILTKFPYYTLHILSPVSESTYWHPFFSLPNLICSPKSYMASKLKKQNNTLNPKVNSLKAPSAQSTHDCCCSAPSFLPCLPLPPAVPAPLLLTLFFFATTATSRAGQGTTWEEQLLQWPSHKPALSKLLPQKSHCPYSLYLPLLCCLATCYPVCSLSRCPAGSSRHGAWWGHCWQPAEWAGSWQLPRS